MKTALQGIGGLLLAAPLALLGLFTTTTAKTLSSALMRASWPALALGAAINVAHNVFRVLRWRWLLDPVRPRVPFRPMFVAVILGLHDDAGSCPGGSGELVRPALLSARGRTSRSDRASAPSSPTACSTASRSSALFAVGSLTSALRRGIARPSRAEIRVTAPSSRSRSIVAGSRRWSRSRRSAGGWTAGCRAGRRPRALGRSRALWGSRAAWRRCARRAASFRSSCYSLLAWLTIALGTWIGIRAAGRRRRLRRRARDAPAACAGRVDPDARAASAATTPPMQIGLTSLFGVDPTIAAGVGI